jgi:hypothetical protein
VERTLIDILVDEKEAIGEITELNRRLKKMQERKDKIIQAFEDGLVEEHTARKFIGDIDGVIKMRDDYLDILKSIQQEMLEAVIKEIAPDITMMTGRLNPEKLTNEYVKNLLEKPRNPRGRTRKGGRIRYGKTNKVQN